MHATKRIPVTPETWQTLGSMKSAGQSYDELLQDMVLAYNRETLANKAKAAQAGQGHWIDLDDLA